MTPGSPSAVERGCTCPIGDNARGQVAWGSSGPDAVFWTDADCPIHGADPARIDGEKQ